MKWSSPRDTTAYEPDGTPLELEYDASYCIALYRIVLLMVVTCNGAMLYCRLAPVL